MVKRPMCMRLIIIWNLLLCLCIFSGRSTCQDRTTMMAGPTDGQFRIVVAFMAASGDSYKLQSMIIDTNLTKNKKDQPTSYYVDMTATVRSLTNGSKDQKILVIRWEKSGDVEVKCEGGRWAKETAGPELNTIIDTIKVVVQNSPLDAKKVTEFDLPQSVQQKVVTVTVLKLQPHLHPRKLDSRLISQNWPAYEHSFRYAETKCRSACISCKRRRS